MAFSKIDVSKEGFRLLTQQEPWNERRRLVEQLYAWFGNALVETKQRHHELFSSLVSPESLNGKITRGDNYKGFPYVLLDYPNFFSKENILAARNLIWLGNGFYCTLHVRGDLLENVLNAITNLPPSRFENVLVYTGNDEWQHHVDENWKTIAHVGQADLTNALKQNWLKLGSTVDLHEPENWNAQLEAIYKRWKSLLSVSTR